MIQDGARKGAEAYTAPDLSRLGEKERYRLVCRLLRPSPELVLTHIPQELYFMRLVSKQRALLSTSHYPPHLNLFGPHFQGICLCQSRTNLSPTAINYFHWIEGVCGSIPAVTERTNPVSLLRNHLYDTYIGAPRCNACAEFIELLMDDLKEHWDGAEGKASIKRRTRRKTGFRAMGRVVALPSSFRSRRERSVPSVSNTSSNEWRQSPHRGRFLLVDLLFPLSWTSSSSHSLKTPSYTSVPNYDSALPSAPHCCPPTRLLVSVTSSSVSPLHRPLPLVLSHVTTSHWFSKDVLSSSIQGPPSLERQGHPPSSRTLFLPSATSMVRSSPATNKTAPPSTDDVNRRGTRLRPHPPPLSLPSRAAQRPPISIFPL
jgi:hypothetical protein